ncbi:MAG: hypothetical protein MJ182_09270 [Treponema sp.]|nr:hypothetical protein [Treponema sp.]
MFERLGELLSEKIEAECREEDSCGEKIEAECREEDSCGEKIEAECREEDSCRGEIKAVRDGDACKGENDAAVGDVDACKSESAAGGGKGVSEALVLGALREKGEVNGQVLHPGEFEEDVPVKILDADVSFNP